MSLQASISAIQPGVLVLAFVPVAAVPRRIAGNGLPAPQTSLIRRFVRAYRGSDPPPIDKDRFMLLQIGFPRITRKIVATVTAIALTISPMTALAQEEKG